MDTMLTKLIDRTPVTDADIAEHLYDICDSVHASCGTDCPVFAKNKGPINPKGSKYGCATFKNGTAMLRFLRDEPVDA